MDLVGVFDLLSHVFCLAPRLAAFLTCESRLRDSIVAIQEPLGRLAPTQLIDLEWQRSGLRLKYKKAM